MKRVLIITLLAVLISASGVCALAQNPKVAQVKKEAKDSSLENPLSQLLRPGKRTPANVLSWARVRSSDIAVVSSEWSSPSWVEEVNTTGWEDGPYISSDGKELYFAYINVNLLKLPKLVQIGPVRDTHNICTPPCGTFPRADLFYATKDAQGKWQEARPHPLSQDYPIGGIVLANSDKAYFMKEEKDGFQTEICSADKVAGQWQKPQKIVALSSRYKDDDPYVTPQGEDMFFWSNRPAALKGNNIYYAKKTNGVWGEPVILPEPINSNANDMQPFLFGNTLYFSSDREGKLTIYRSALENNTWSKPETVISSAHGVGEPTLTADGRFLYFVQIFVNKNGDINPDIMYVKKRISGE
ncbi:MAG: PD40 domain-containing protein [Candidatus Omnitrophica bacterium]|nr:PD40 domain-containing protein [Candidatus Omnitrophota bacterium]